MTARTVHPAPDVLNVGFRNRLGESPWWDGTALSWVDIFGLRVHRALLDGSDASGFATPGQPGFAIPDGDGFVVGLPDGVWHHSTSADAWTQRWVASHDPDVQRINDGKTDPAGRLWFGTMTYDESAPVSSLFRLDAAGASEQMGGVITSNGLGWSPVGTTMYYADSPARVIWAFDYDPSLGAISGRRVFTRDPEGYFPDGLSVDDEGCVWSAKWNGGKVVRYSPDGRVDLVLEVPVARPTSVAFAGSDRSTLAITTADPGDPALAHELDGLILLVPSGTTGPLLASPR